MIINVLPAPSARPARYREALVRLLNQHRPGQHELQQMRAQATADHQDLHLWEQQLAAALEPLTSTQADWIARMSDRDSDFQRVLTYWTAAGSPLVQRDYHSLRTLELLAEQSCITNDSMEA